MKSKSLEFFVNLFELLFEFLNIFIFDFLFILCSEDSIAQSFPYERNLVFLFWYNFNKGLNLIFSISNSVFDNFHH